MNDFESGSTGDELNPLELAKNSLQSLQGLIISDAEAAETIPQRQVVDSRIEVMPDHNMGPGFSRYKIFATFEGEPEKLVGSFFEMEDPQARADFVSNDKHPQYFDTNGRPNFAAIEKDFNGQAVIVAGAFLAPGGDRQIEGVALENGEMVGQATPKSSLNGLLVIENGNPRIEYLNQLSNFQEFLGQLKQSGGSLFQQTSFIRPGGKFSSSNPLQYELRFFVEGGEKKGVVNFTENMTYGEALQVMEQTSNFNIQKAIGLDTGIASEGFFYDKNGQHYLMVDEDFGEGRSCTNMLVLHSIDTP
ncbi:hypothetical protein HN748_04260 [Candidatus Peregrinibacteria bacterium]|nr:hypothetical protein [Candidatus Peregrinibacteria bacterium]MBT7483472.1 hypothetical protein [Candidatus Peregrinibacteria bacterium]MBT7703423.1 hypothetical protein [Candidatus Peregrinibacteria bacterium]